MTAVEYELKLSKPTPEGTITLTIRGDRAVIGWTPKPHPVASANRDGSFNSAIIGVQTLGLPKEALGALMDLAETAAGALS